MEERPIIGGSARRDDSLGKVLGSTRYVEDIPMQDLHHIKVVRSPHHHARLLSLDAAPALQIPGVLRVISAEDIPGENSLLEFSPSEPVLTPLGETAKQIGAPIALVIGSSAASAAAGARAVEMTYEVLPHFLTIGEALAEDAPQLYPGGNLLGRYEVLRGDIGATLEGSAHRLETHYQTSFQEHSALERDSYLGLIDEEGRVTVTGGNHEPYWKRSYMAGALGLSPDKVRVITPPTGGSFGNRQDAWPFSATAVAAYLCRRPVLLAYSRREAFEFSTKRHAYQVRYRMGADHQGKLTGFEVRIAANTGGYDSQGIYIPNYAITASGGPYHWPVVDAEAQVFFSNGPRCGAFRGFGAPQAVFALECSLDELIQQLGDDPIEFRLRNVLPQDEISFLGYRVAEKLGYAEVLETLRPHHQRLQAQVAAYNAQSDGQFRRGVGVAGLWHRFGKSGSLRIETQAELGLDGTFTAYFSAPDYGQGVNTVVSQLSAETLGVPRSQIRLVNADTASVPASGISGASRSTYWIGNSICNGFSSLKAVMLAEAGEILGCSPEALRLTSEAVIGKEGSISLAELAAEFERIGKARRVLGVFDLTGQFPPGSSPEYTPHFVTGAHLAEVQVDMSTGLVEVRSIVAAHDVGRAINPPDARGQIEGAVVMGLGTALTEEFVPGVSSGFSNYLLPTVQALPEITVELVEVPGYLGPYGAKGLGEPAIFAVMPSIVNAISRAIGSRLRRTPATPERVLQAIQSNHA